MEIKNYPPVLYEINILSDLVGNVHETITGVNSFFHAILNSTNSKDYWKSSTRDKSVAVTTLRRKLAKCITKKSEIFNISPEKEDENAFEFIKAWNGHPKYYEKLGWTRSFAISRFVEMCNNFGFFGALTDRGYFPPTKKFLRAYEILYSPTSSKGKKDRAKEYIIEFLTEGPSEDEEDILYNFDPFKDLSQEFLETFYTDRSDDPNLYDASRHDPDFEGVHSFEYFVLLGGEKSFTDIKKRLNLRDFDRLLDSTHQKIDDELSLRWIAQSIGIGIVIIDEIKRSDQVNTFKIFYPLKVSDSKFIILLKTEEGYSSVSISDEFVFTEGSFPLSKIFEVLSIEVNEMNDSFIFLDKIGIPHSSEAPILIDISTKRNSFSISSFTGSNRGSKKSTEFKTLSRSRALSGFKMFNHSICEKIEELRQLFGDTTASSSD